MNRLLKILIFSVLLLLLLVGGGYAALLGYVSVRQARLVRQARAFLDKSEEKKALLCLQRALRSNSKDLEANRLMATLLERHGSQQALLQRSKVVELAPTSTDDRLALARTALAFKDLITASNALEGLSPEAKQKATYYNLSGMVATAAGHPASAETHFLTACQLEPTNLVAKLNLAVIRLQQTNVQARTQAQVALQQLSTDSVYGCQALRELVGDALRHRETNEAVIMSRQLVQHTNSTFSDKLLQLDVLRFADDPTYESTLLAVQRAGADDIGKARQMAAWLVSRTGPARALPWMESLSPDIRTNQPVVLLMAECRDTLKDWTGLQTSLQQQHWGELDFMRHAFLARSLRGQELASTAKTEWEQALKDAQSRQAGRQESLAMLLRLAAAWNWTSESEQLLWTFVNQYPKEKWAPVALAQLLYTAGRTQGLMTLYSQLSKVNPDDLLAKNNLSMVALLLDAPQHKPHELAREVYQKAPTNSSYASTYAFSLYRQEKAAEARKVLEQLPQKDLDKPSIAGYYGLVLRALGDTAKAKKYLDLAVSSTNLTFLPEERKLIDQARQM